MIIFFDIYDYPKFRTVTYDSLSPTITGIFFELGFKTIEWCETRNMWCLDEKEFTKFCLQYG